MAKKKKKPGRPPKSPSLKRTCRLVINLSESEREEIRDAAIRSPEGGDVSAWARPVLLERARIEYDDLPNYIKD